MNTHQDLIDRTTINFPRPITEEEAKVTLAYLGRVLEPCKINYNFSGFGNIIRPSPEGYGDENYVAGISGMISLTTDPYLLEGFSFLRDVGDNKGVFSGLKIETTPGYSLEEISEEQLKFYDSIRKHLDNFFKES